MTAPTAWLETMGAGVTVAVCDTGINAAHPDLSGQVINGYNTASNSTDTSDINGHGPGSRASSPPRSQPDWRRVGRTGRQAPRDAHHRPHRQLGVLSDMAECIAWAADHGARIANLSFNGAAGSSTVAGAGSYMMSKGGVVVVAAGNDGADMGYTNSDYLFTAGATTSADARASYSNYGGYIDIAAPGSASSPPTAAAGTRR